MVRAEKNMILSESKEETDRDDAEILSDRQEFLTRLGNGEAIASPEGRPKWAAIRAAWQPRQAIQDKMREAAKSGALQEAKNLSAGQARTIIAEVRKPLAEIIGSWRGRERTPPSNIKAPA
jgi:methyl-accepting chemotaxis protein